MNHNYQRLAQQMKALADETRVKIFAMLSRGELCACNILEEFKITQPTLSYHMKVLTESGLVSCRKDGVWMKYSLNRDGLEEVKGLFESVGVNLESPAQCPENC